MPVISREVIFGKLGEVGMRSLQGAFEFARLRRDAYLEPVHWLAHTLRTEGADLPLLADRLGLDRGRLAKDLERSLAGLRRADSSRLDFSRDLELAIERGWISASLLFGDPRIRTGHVLHGMLEQPELKRLLHDLSGEFRKVAADDLALRFAELTDGSAEAAGAAEVAAPASPEAADTKSGKALDRFTADLTEQARSGKLDPVLGRDREIREVVDILMRRRQNNPIVVGEAGVGKTALVEGLALRIAAGDVPPMLREVRLLALDLAAMQAGASVRGEFESRLKQVIDDVQRSPRPIVLFIDEAHALIGAGGAAGTGDAANLLKPALARGTLRTIAATTWAEYKRHIEKDPALTRRFQPVQVDEPSSAQAIAMLRGVAARLEAHHGVRILEDGVAAAVRLSQRYVTGRQLPDKSVSVLDTAAARVAMAQAHAPAALEELARRCLELDQEIAGLETEARLGAEHADALEQLRDARASAEERRGRLASAWQQERDTVGAIRAVERRLLLATDEAEAARVRHELGGLRLELEVLQEAGQRLVPVTVDGNAVAEVVSGWTGIPTGRMLAEGAAGARGLRGAMAARIVGQEVALDTICRRIQTYFAGLGEPGKPTGVFLLTGPSGVGKTETALALAELLFGGPAALVTVNLSEYQEAHSVALLKGAPPGYVGHGKGGVLTEAVRRRPYCVLLLDEVEMAHADVVELFYQVLDKGVLEDSDGQTVDFTNTVILLTSNVGAEVLEDARGGRRPVDAEALARAVRPALLRRFPAAFLGRVVTVPYLPLGEAELDAVVGLKLARIQQRFEASHRAALSWDQGLVHAVRARAGETESGARAVDAILTHGLLPGLAGGVLERVADGRGFAAVHVGVGDDGELSFAFRP
jgi:type VI secretion system protein VasG